MPSQGYSEQNGGGGAMDALTATVTATSLTIVSFGEPDLDRWKEMVNELGIAHRSLFMDDYQCDGERHVWRFTFAYDRVEIAS